MPGEKPAQGGRARRISEYERSTIARSALARHGPKTPAGRARAAQNARRHGLSVPDLWEAALSPEVEALARRICRPGAGDAGREAHLLALARRIAAAQVDLMRVRRARHDLVATKFADPAYRTSKGLAGRIAMLSRVGDMLARGEPIPPALAEAVHKRPQGADKFAVILAELSPQLIAMDRYERRALTRRKFAVRAYDAVMGGDDARARPGASRKAIFAKRNNGG